MDSPLFPTFTQKPLQNDSNNNGDNSEPVQNEPEKQIVFPLTDFGNALRLYSMAKTKMRFIRDKKEWTIWDERIGKWQVKDDLLFRELKRNLILPLYKECRLAKQGVNLVTFNQEQVEKEEIQKWVKSSSSKSRLQSALNILKDFKGISINFNELDANHYYLGVENGVVDLKNGELIENKPDYLITRYCITPYDPDADCPNFQKFIQEITLNRRDLADFLQELTGYILSGFTNEQIFTIFWGLGANGKSTLVELLSDILGPYACGMPSATFVKSSTKDIRPELARLPGIRLATSVEINNTSKLDESLVKKITGGDTIAEREPWKGLIDFKPMAKVLFSVNALPIITGVDNGIFRRFIVVPFDANFQGKEDIHLFERLKQEKKGILAWAVKGFLRYLDRGKFNIPDCVKEACAYYRQSMDVVGAFLNEMCKDDPSDKIPIGELFDAYQTWAQNAYVQTVGKHNFSTLVEQKGYKRRKSGSWNFEGLSWKSHNKQQNNNINILGNFTPKHQD